MFSVDCKSSSTFFDKAGDDSGVLFLKTPFLWSPKKTKNKHAHTHTQIPSKYCSECVNWQCTSSPRMTSSPSEPCVWFVLCLSSLSAAASSSLASWSSSAFDSFLRAMMEAYKGQVIDVYKHDKSMENMKKWKSWKKPKHFSYDTHWEQNKDH